MKLGDAELEPLNTEISCSTLAARRIFLDQILRRSTRTTRELLRPFDPAGIPAEYRESEKYLNILRCFFLNCIAKPELTEVPFEDLGLPDELRNTPVHAMGRFIHASRDRLESFFEQSRAEWESYTRNPSDRLIAETAFQKLIPGWSELEADPLAGELRRQLLEWAENWHLTDEWCLDFALAGLIEFKVVHVDVYSRISGAGFGNPVNAFNEHYVNEWSWKAWHSATFDLYQQRHRVLLAALPEIPPFEPFVFHWREKDGSESEVFGIEEYFASYSMTMEAFAERAERNFWDGFLNRFRDSPSELVGQLGHITIELDRLRSELRRYITKSNQHNKLYGRPVIEKDSGDLHFRWLVDYQVIGKSYDQIAQESERGRSSVLEAVKQTAELIGLTIRGSKKGRKAGVKEKRPRRVAE